MMKARSHPTESHMDIILAEQDQLTVKLTGQLSVQTISPMWQSANELLAGQTLDKPVQIDLSDLGYCDGFGIGLLSEIRSRVERAGGRVTYHGCGEDLQKLIDVAALKDPKAMEPVHKPPSVSRMLIQIGTDTLQIVHEILAIISFIGRMVQIIFWPAAYPGGLRYNDIWLVCLKAGVNSLPVMILLGFLMGLIIAFQSAIPMSQYGAQSLIPTIIAVAMVRELGPFLTAIILAGRSGSAFAAEIGTMKITEEINALLTFGLDPVKFLVLPRVVAAMIMTPLLSLFTTLAGLIGGYVIMASLEYSLHLYTELVLQSIDYIDLLQGIFKTFVFAILVAAVGCLQGLRTQSGPSAVGDSATRAVVAGIILVIVADGALGVMFYYLGI